MEKKIVLGLFLVAIFLGCVQKTPEISEVNLETTTTQNIEFPSENFEIFVSSDKELYHSNEFMNISVKVESSEKVEKVRINLYGIHSGRYRLKRKRIEDLEKGENQFYFSYRTPRCYGCAGIVPGSYEITAEVEYIGEIRVKDSKEIEIRK